MFSWVDESDAVECESCGHFSDRAIISMVSGEEHIMYGFCDWCFSQYDPDTTWENVQKYRHMFGLEVWEPDED